MIRPDHDIIAALNGSDVIPVWVTKSGFVTAVEKMVIAMYRSDHLSGE